MKHHHYHHHHHHHHEGDLQRLTERQEIGTFLFQEFLLCHKSSQYREILRNLHSTENFLRNFLLQRISPVPQIFPVPRNFKKSSQYRESFEKFSSPENFSCAKLEIFTCGHIHGAKSGKLCKFLVQGMGGWIISLFSSSRIVILTIAIIQYLIMIKRDHPLSLEFSSLTLS